MDTGASSALDVQLLLAQVSAHFDGERDAVANAANLCAFIMQTWSGLNWAGFYFVRAGELVLGPFQGKPAVARIAHGAGVCGTAWAQRRTLVVADVHTFEGHIACDGSSNSEIVIPLIRAEVVLGVLDLDSPEFDRFDEADRTALEALAALYVSASGPLKYARESWGVGASKQMFP